MDYISIIISESIYAANPKENYKVLTNPELVNIVLDVLSKTDKVIVIDSLTRYLRELIGYNARVGKSNQNERLI